MARQIATLFLRRLEVPIVIRDVKQEIVDEALADIRAEIDGQVAKGRYDEGKGRFLSSLVSGSTDYDGFAELRPRARGGVRGARGEEAGVRRARADRARRVRARDEHLGPVDHRHGRRPAPARARRRHALLQPGRADAAARGRARRRDRRRGARDGVGRRREARASGRSSSTTRRASSSTAC